MSRQPQPIRARGFETAGQVDRPGGRFYALRKIGGRVGMPNRHNGQRNGAGGAPAGHFAHSRRRIETNEITLDTIAESLLRIFVRMKNSTHRSGN